MKRFFNSRSTVNGCFSFEPYSEDDRATSARRVSQGILMRNILVMVLYFIACLLGFFPNPAHSSSPEQNCLMSIGSSWGPEPIRLQGGCISPPAPSENIRLDVMSVTMRGKRDSYTVDAVFHLFNTGETTTVTVGVPKYGRADECDLLDKYVVCDFLGFDAWVDGRKVGFVEVRDFFTDPSARPIGGYCRHLSSKCVSLDDGTETRWMTKKITFPGKATTKIRIRYEAPYHNHYVGSGAYEEDGYYHCSTGRYWKGKIKKATFVIDTTDTHDGWRPPYGPGGLRWAPTKAINRDEIRDFEPSAGSYRLIPGNWRGTQVRRDRLKRFAPTSCGESW
jgi:hypothetical protein